MKGKHRIKNRLLLLILTLALIITYMPASMTAYAAESDTIPAPDSQTEAPVKAKAAFSDGTTVLAFTSDVHNGGSRASGNQAAIRMDTWLDNVLAIYQKIDVMSFCGDMASAGANESQFWTLANAVMDVVDEDIPQVHTTGNHEYYNGKFSTTSNEVKDRYIIDAQAMEGDNYIIYCLGTDNWNNNQDNYTSDQISTLETYLTNTGNNKPIIILTHYPLHYYRGNMTRQTDKADQVIDVLNNAAAAGKKIVLLWGHNHSVSDTHYDAVYQPGDTLQYKQGSSKTIDFYYGAAGCMSDSENGSGSEFVKGKGLVMTIDDDNMLTFTYYDANANDVTEGGTYIEGDPVDAESIEVTPKTLTVEAGSSKSLTVTFTPAETTNKKITWTSSDTSIATVNTSGEVTGVAAGTAVITATYENTDLTDTCEVTVTKPAGQGVTPENGKRYVILASDGYALTSEGDTVGYSNGDSNNGQYNYIGLTGEEYTVGEDVAPDRLLWTFTESEDGSGFYIQSQDGKYLCGSYETNSTGGYDGTLKLDNDSKDIWVLTSLSGTTASALYLKSTTASQGDAGDKFLTHGNKSSETVSNIFTMRSEDNATSNKFYEYNENGTFIEDPDEPDEPDPEDGTIYKLVDTFTDGGEYLIVNANSDGSAYALTNPGGSSDGTSMGSTNVTISSGDIDGDGTSEVYIESDKTDIVWTAAANGEGYNLANGTDFLEGKGGNVKVFSALEYSDRYWTYTGNQLQHVGGRNTYTVYYDDGYTSTYNSTDNKVYLYEKTNNLQGDDPVESVQLNKTEITLTTGDKEQLKATVFPATAADKTVTWSSEDEAVATVDQNGLVTAVGEGTTTITATASDGEHCAECAVTVNAFVPPDGTVYKLVDQFQGGGEYLIVNANSDGSAYALTNPGGSSDGTSMGSTNVTISSGDIDGDGTSEVYIESDKTDIVWTAAANGEGYNLANGTDFLEGKGGNVKVFSALEYSDRYWTYTGNQLQHVGGRNTYTVYYDDGYTSTYNSTDNKVYLYEKTETGQSEHIWGDWEITTEPTCTTAGIMTRTCSECGSTQTKEIEALGHNMTEHPAAPATCHSEGNSTFWSCDRCGKFFSDEDGNNVIDSGDWIIPVTDHSPGEKVREREKAASCEDKGSYDEVIYCTICNEEISRNTVETPALGHNWSDWAETPATEVTEGQRTRSCTRCDETETVIIPKLEHLHILTKVDAKAATCTEAGNPEYWVCNGESELFVPCHKYFADKNAEEELSSEDIIIAASGHNSGDPVRENEKAASCTENGSYDEVVYCTVCNEEVSRKTMTIPATGHAWSDWAVIKPATELTEGEESRTCSNCGETETRIIPKLLHHHILSKVDAKAATCSEDGNIEYWVCDKGLNPCGKYFSDQLGQNELNYEDIILPATGHDWGEPVFEWSADNSSAAAVFTCKHDRTHVETVEAEVTAVTTPSSCESDGKTIYTAKATLGNKSGIYTKEVPIHATGHDYELSEWLWAADHSSASAKFICKNNNTHIEVVDAAVTSETTNATCTKSGKTVYTAKVKLGNKDYEDSKEIMIPKTGHNYKLSEWKWTGLTKADAIFVCGNDSTHLETVEAEITTNTTEATCDAAGKVVYTAVAELEGTPYTYVKEIELPKKEHNWGTPVYEWADDFSTVKATRICNDFVTHIETETAETTATVSKSAACETKGETTYTATFENKAFTAQAKTIVNIPELGHAYSEPSYTWAEDNSSVTARRTCANDPSHVEEETVSATFAETKAATEVTAGTGIWTSADFQNPVFFAQSKIVRIPNLSQSSDPDKPGSGGTAFAPGSSAASAEKAITNMTKDRDPEGTVFGKIQLRSSKQTKSSITLNWTKVSGSKKYVIYGNKCGKSNKPRKLSAATGSKKKITSIAGTKVKKGTYYKFIIVALDKNNRVISTSKLIHTATKGGKIGNYKSVTVSKSVLKKARNMKKNQKLKISAKAAVQAKKLKVKQHVKMRYETSNSKVAIVSSGGTIKAVGKGTCYVYAYAQNGVFKKIKVVVK